MLADVRWVKTDARIILADVHHFLTVRRVLTDVAIWTVNVKVWTLVRY